MPMAPVLARLVLPDNLPPFFKVDEKSKTQLGHTRIRSGEPAPPCADQNWLADFGRLRERR
jgi:hypothetical protein